MRCARYIDGTKRCTETARYRVVSPSGFTSSHLCHEHGIAVRSEYWTKLRQSWLLVPVDENGRDIEDEPGAGAEEQRYEWSDPEAESREALSAARRLK